MMSTREVTAAARATAMTVRLMLSSQSMRKNAVIRLPAMLPRVEMAEIEPAVLPLASALVAKRRMAIGDTVANSAVGTANRSAVATRACIDKLIDDDAMPGEISASSHGTEINVIAAPISMTTIVEGCGRRSPIRPPAQYPMLIAARKTAMTAVVSRNAVPKVLPTMRKATISAAMSIAPLRKTAKRRTMRSNEVIGRN